MNDIYIATNRPNLVTKIDNKANIKMESNMKNQNKVLKSKSPKWK